ncbi:ImmA/IrrE family metallo-endopeptidase [Pseudoduganella namucuonensis]|uniref:Zn-dependent peptidase ImmA, M78 family n=1 Tax=Pseudoduganella namucuonensis TaxID=1035707 RepID=A0A1I7K897_9BURK|nr:ImmA/IrrE family metallo-endopeptidase [Pseudoduganella namucuonensis]SFU93664.1 Zn-dependent peptidase ImmA, M78 family [Pseudoduganella namucuonensis]
MALAEARPRTGVEAATKVLEHYWDGRIPIRPELIAERMKVAMVGRGAQGDDAYQFSGYFSFRDGVPTIEYNVNDPLVRRRFTVAHELGHFILGHQDAPRDYPDSFGSKNNSLVERQANQFAAELLMPAKVVKAMAFTGLTSVEALAEAFAVSKVAMGHRLSNLSLNT